MARHGSTPRHTFHRFMIMLSRPSLHNCQGPISSNILGLLVSLAGKPSEYDQIAPKIEYWIEYVLRENFVTVDELVEEVSYTAWEGSGSFASVARFFKEFRDAPHRSEQARSFVTQLCPHVLRWFAIASVESLPMTRPFGPIASNGGCGFIRAASFVGHLIERGLLSHELVRRHLIKPLTNHYDNDYKIILLSNAIYQLFITAGRTLLQGLLEDEDVLACFQILDVQSTAGKIEGYDAARVKVWCTTYTKASPVPNSWTRNFVKFTTIGCSRKTRMRKGIPGTLWLPKSLQRLKPPSLSSPKNSLPLRLMLGFLPPSCKISAFPLPWITWSLHPRPLSMYQLAQFPPPH